MRKKDFVCEVCGFTYPRTEYAGQLQWFKYRDGHLSFYDRLMMCPRCEGELQAWIASTKKRPPEKEAEE